MRNNKRVVVVIPALNEAAALPGVLGAIPGWVDKIIVADNNSTDNTAITSEKYGAQVIHEARRGYGWACQAGIDAASEADILVFLDGDGSDYPEVMADLVDPIAEDKTDFVVGSRTRGTCEPGALNIYQRAGNGLACWLIRLRWGHRYSDLGPFRAIRRSQLLALSMSQMTFGWTVEMQIRALRANISILEVPINYRRGLGRSKVSGTLRGVLSAGYFILRVIASESIRGPIGARP